MKNPARLQAERGFSTFVRPNLLAFFELGIDDVIVTLAGLLAA